MPSSLSQFSEVSNLNLPRGCSSKRCPRVENEFLFDPVSHTHRSPRFGTLYSRLEGTGEVYWLYAGE